MDLRRRADYLLTFLLRTDWPKVSRRLVWSIRKQTSLYWVQLKGQYYRIKKMRKRDWERLGRRSAESVRRIDIRKPFHAVIVGLMVATIAAPIIGQIATNARYSLGGPEADVVTKPAPHLENKLVYQPAQQQSVFNLAGQQTLDSQMPDTEMSRVGGADSKDTQLYTATFPNTAANGITVNDNVNKVPITFKPLFGLMGGRDEDGHVVYPLSGMNGQTVYTPKANGLKEDIILNSSPGDSADFQYELDVPDYVQPRINEDGSIGFYTADPVLFGNISYGTQADEASVMKARVGADKTYEMFSVPAPVFIESGGYKGFAEGRFSLSGDTLTLHVTGMNSANYPLSIDPTFYLASTADFLLGSSDDNIDLSVANQVGRAVLNGGQLAAWTQDNCGGVNLNMPINDFSFGITAYNGFLYMMGGTNNGNQTVYYADINLTSGAVGCTTTWTELSGTQSAGNGGGTGFNVVLDALVGEQIFGYNGYLYAVGGENPSGTIVVTNHTEYAQIATNGTLSANSGCGTTFCYGNNLNTARAFFGSALYEGVIYAFGGSTNDNPIDSAFTTSVEYSRVNGDGSLGTWTTTTSLTSARDRFSGSAYNGYVYVAGGQITPGAITTINTVQYAPINSDGSLGSWTTTTSFPTGRRDFGFATERGHMYVYGGCTTGNPCGNFLGDSEYAVINADGTLGQWQQTQNTASRRGSTDEMATAFYNGFLYSAGGCSSEATGSNNCKTAGRTKFVGFTNVNPPGSFDGLSNLANIPYNPTASSVARFGGQAVALNGYVYYIGGSSSTTGAAYSAVVSYAQINTDGSLAAWSTTTALPAQTGDNAGRIGFTLAGFGTKLYVIGGVELTTGGAHAYQSSVLSDTQNTNGTLGGTWGAENALPAVTAFHTTVIWNNWIYAIGGRDSTTTVKNTIYESQIGTTGTLGTWATSTNHLGTAVWGHSSVVYGNYVYVVSGETNTTGTLTTTVQIGTVQSSGDISGWTTTTAIGTAVMYARAMVHNNFLYVMGGSVAGTTQVTIAYVAITPGTGALGTWSTTGIGASTFSGTDGLDLSRSAEAAVAVDGYMYIIGGCETTESVTVFDTCTTIIPATATTETEDYQPNNGGTGQTGGWSTTGVTALTTAKADAAALAYNGYVYSIGGCTGYTTGACTGSAQFSTDVRYAAINSDGTLGTWTAASNQLGTGTMLLQAEAYNGFMYILGGQTNATAAITTVQYAAIGSTGDIGTWTAANAMGTARKNFGAAIENGYIYALGGVNASGTKLATTEYALINSDGSLGTWGSSTSFTTARSGLGVIAYAGNVYVIGGSDSSSNTLQDIQYAPLNSGTGAIGTWGNTIAFPRGTVARQTFAANGYMYFIGNEGNNTEVSYADISSNGTLGTLHDQPNALAGAHSHGSLAYYNGIFYLFGGCTLSGANCTTVSATGEKAGQLAISRAAHYSKLWQTQGVDTAPSQISLNGTLQGQGSAVAATLRTSSSFDAVLGVPQVINPVIFNTFYRVYALNHLGVNVGVANTYALEVKLDDTEEGTFPDIASSQTAVTSITLYYHANPGRRLRHGASFSNVGCNITPQNGCILDTAP